MCLYYKRNKHVCQFGILHKCSLLCLMLRSIKYFSRVYTILLSHRRELFDLYVKARSIIIGHISSVTTLDIYSHVTDTTHKQATVKIEHQISKMDAPMSPDEQNQHADKRGFQPYKSKYRKSVTGGIYQLNDHRGEDQYSPRDAHGK